MPRSPRVSEPDVLQRVTRRLVGDDERDAFDRTLEEQRYLAHAHLAGQTLRDVAELDGQGVALLTCSVAALHLKGREQWRRWSPRQRARRLGLVVNNSRRLRLTLAQVPIEEKSNEIPALPPLRRSLPPLAGPLITAERAPTPMA